MASQLVTAATTETIDDAATKALEEAYSVILQKVRLSLGGIEVLQGVDLAVRKAEFFSLLGPSGAGKSSILNVIAGFTPVNAGTVWLEGRDITHVPAHRRDLGFIFQEYALFPHLSVEQNVRFPLEMRRVPRREGAHRVQDALEMVGLGGMGKRNPRHLSGGQRQRVAIARALVFHPRIILMDEPLSSLDRQLREEMTTEIRSLQRRLGVTVIYVTHDQAEALTLSDRIAILRAGLIEQLATPEMLHDHPASSYAAKLSGPINLADAVPVGAPGPDGIRVLQLGAHTVRAPVWASEEMVPVGDRLVLGVRPYALVLDREPADTGQNCVPGRLFSSSITGSGHQYLVEIEGKSWQVVATRHVPNLRIGDRVYLRWPVEATILMSE